jgi:hypothetical protein
MVRSMAGLWRGLVAGLTCAAFYAIVSVAWLGETSLPAFFAQLAQALPPLHNAAATPGVVALGVALHFAIAAAFGLAYAALASRLRSMWRAPTSVIWGIGYGAFVWWLLNDVAVPVSGATNVQPLWEGLVGTILFYGVVLSELTTVAYRRQAVLAP